MPTSPDPQQRRLRWWQEESPAASPASLIASPGIQAQAQRAAPPQTELETEDALEAEAVRRTELLKDAVVIQSDNRKFSRQQMATGALILTVAALQTTSPTHHHLWLHIVQQIFMVLNGGMLIALGWWLGRQPPTRLTLSRLGVTLENSLYTIGPIFWDEIKTVRVSRILFHRSVVLEMKDPKATYKRAIHAKPAAQKSFWLRPRAILPVPIQIDETFFGVKAGEVMAHIARFRSNQP